jgi:hypothetical protein
MHEDNARSGDNARGCCKRMLQEDVARGCCKRTLQEDGGRADDERDVEIVDAVALVLAKRWGYRVNFDIFDAVKNRR